MRFISMSFILFSCQFICTNAYAQFPVQRAEQEFRSLIPFLEGWGQQNQGNQDMFKRWSLPYAPLYLEVRSAINHQETSNLLNYYLGIAGAVFNINSGDLAKSFHCGPDCTNTRRSDVVSKLEQINDLVLKFRKMPNIKLIANWGVGDDFRVNDLYRIMGQQKITYPSPIMGFVPSNVWESVAVADDYIKSLGEKPDDVHTLLKIMRDLSIAAIVREENGITRVVRVGISDNESGLLFTEVDKPPYALGEETKDVRKIQLIEKIKPNVYFYETT